MRPRFLAFSSCTLDRSCLPPPWFVFVRMRACLVSLWPSSFARSLPLLSPLRSSTSFIDPCSSQRQQLRRPSPLSPSLSLSLPPLFSSYSRPTPRLCSPLLSSSLRNIRTYSSGRPTDRSYARPTLAAMLLQEATVDGGGGSDCRHTTATGRCYRVAVAVAAAILFSCQRKCCSSEGKEEISALR